MLRQRQLTVQALLIGGPSVSKAFLKWLGACPCETILDIEGTVVATPSPVTACTVQHIELYVSKAFVVSRGDPRCDNLLLSCALCALVIAILRVKSQCVL